MTPILPLSKKMPPAVATEGLTHRYGQAVALEALTLDVAPGEVFAFLGPNGGGKTTLFRILSTLIAPQQGRAAVMGCELPGQRAEARRRLGVVFQSPSLDKKLTVMENMWVQAALYGLDRGTFQRRATELLERLHLTDRANQRTETLSGGLRRRAELAKGMLHSPQLLLLDEPSAGLDPGARSDLWKCLSELRAAGATIVLTTHLLEEAERADRIAILDRGRLVALGPPQQLRSEQGGDTITIAAADPQSLAAAVTAKWSVPAQVVDGQVRLEQPEGHRWMSRLFEEFGDRIDAVTVGKPTLEDVFIQRTGHRFN